MFHYYHSHHSLGIFTNLLQEHLYKIMIKIKFILFVLKVLKIMMSTFFESQVFSNILVIIFKLNLFMNIQNKKLLYSFNYQFYQHQVLLNLNIEEVKVFYVQDLKFGYVGLLTYQDFYQIFLFFSYQYQKEEDHLYVDYYQHH